MDSEDLLNENDEYIISLLENVDLYTTFPKPKGKNSASVINQMSAKILDSFAILEEMGRLDIVSHILTKFAAVRDILEPVEYFTWVRLGVRKLSNEGLYEVYLMNKSAFEAWLDSKEIFEHAILDIAKKIGAVCTRSEYTEFKNMVESRFGNVRNIDYYFKGE